MGAGWVVAVDGGEMLPCDTLKDFCIYPEPLIVGSQQAAELPQAIFSRFLAAEELSSCIWWVGG